MFPASSVNTSLTPQSLTRHLCFTAENWDKDRMISLIEKKADLNSFNSKLSLAILAAKGNIEGIKLLIEKKAALPSISDIICSITSTIGEETPKEKKIDALKFFLDSKVDANSSSNHHSSPLQCAVDSCLENDEEFVQEIVQLLLDHGSNPNQHSRTGGFPLISAISNQRNIQLIRLLIDRNADVNVKNRKNETPVLEAGKRARYYSIPEGNQILQTLFQVGGTPLSLNDNDCDENDFDHHEYTKTEYNAYKNAVTQELMREVAKVDPVNPKNNDAQVQPAQPPASQPMLPFPVSGGHVLLFRLITDYIYPPLDT